MDEFVKQWIKNLENDPEFQKHIEHAILFGQSTIKIDCEKGDMKLKHVPYFVFDKPSAD